MSGFNDAVSREATWLTTDPPAGTTSVQFPPLQVANGGYYDLVQSYFPKVIPRQKSLFLSCEGIKNDELIEFQAHRDVVYQMLLTSYWSIESTDLETDQANHDAAINAVLLRIRGLIADKTHGNQFIAVAAGGPEGDGRITMRMPNSYNQITNRESLMAEIRYFASDWLVGGQ